MVGQLHEFQMKHVLAITFYSWYLSCNKAGLTVGRELADYKIGEQILGNMLSRSILYHHMALISV